MISRYRNTVDLLLKILPIALKDSRFALKGGTAINLFHRDYPRLSVDIDLCYLPLEPRKETFENIHKILEQITTDLENKLKLTVISNHALDGRKEAKLITKSGNVEVKIEPNYTIRGSLFSPKMKQLSAKAQEEFGVEVEVQCLDIADTFGGKICAALDRQHPRDLFDIKNLLENEGITSDVKDSFIFHLISHNRPIDELLDPNLKNLEKQYRDEFLTMTQIDTPLGALMDARVKLVEGLRDKLTEEDKEFLISFVSNKPDWKKIKNDKVRNFPSVKWKRLN